MSSTSTTHEETTPTLGEVLRAGCGLIARLVGEQPAAYALAATGAVVFTSAIVASAFVIGYVTGDLIIPVLDGRAERGDRLVVAIALILGVGVWKAVGIVMRRATAGWLQFGATNRLRKRLIAHQLDLSMSWYGRRAVGDLLSVADNDSRQATFVLAPLPFATGVVFLLLGTLGVVAATDPWLGLAAVVLLTLVVSLDVRGSWLTFTAMQEAQRRRGRVGDVAHESIDGALTVKALGRADAEVQRFRGAAEHLREQLVRVGVVWQHYRALTETLPAIGIVVIVLLGALRIADGHLDAGELVRVAYLLALLAVPIRLLGFIMWEVANSVAGWERVAEVLDVDERVTYGDVGRQLQVAGARVHARSVAFGYASDTPVLHGVQIDVPPGRTIAVVGPTGAGKSTLLQLLARLWDPDEGSIRMDGRDLRDLSRGVIPQEVAFVAQDTFLFDDTVAGNISVGLDVTRDEIEAAARLARAHVFISELPDGYDTLVGERGTTLSGGQRQRVALARALVRRPRLLLLDDATSAVDPSVETEILRGLRDADLPATVIVVAYRRSSIVLADDVIYLDQGRVVAQGSHEELMGTVPGYAALLRAYDEDRDEGGDAA